MRHSVVERAYNVLFLCTGNSARSILAEALINHWGRDRFRGFSAGSFPKGEPHPGAIELLQSMDLPTHQLRSKSWDEFVRADAPALDFIFTVCDNAAGEVCPVWPGKPVTAHWGIADPAAVQGEADQREAFRTAFAQLETRIKKFVALPIASMDGASLQRELQRIGDTVGASFSPSGSQV